MIILRWKPSLSRMAGLQKRSIAEVPGIFDRFKGYPNEALDAVDMKGVTIVKTEE